MIITITKFINIFWKMLKTDFMKLTDDTTFKQGPKRFDGVGMTIAVDPPNRFIDTHMWHKLFDSEIALVLIGD